MSKIFAYMDLTRDKKSGKFIKDTSGRERRKIPKIAKPTPPDSDKIITIEPFSMDPTRLYFVVGGGHPKFIGRSDINRDDLVICNKLRKSGKTGEWQFVHIIKGANKEGFNYYVNGGGDVYRRLKQIWPDKK